MLHIPDILTPEREKYEAIWSKKEYHQFSPGVENVTRFMEVMDPDPATSSLIDIGCGSGLAGMEFAAKGFQIHWLDITDAGLNPEVNRKRFIRSQIWGPTWSSFNRRGWDYGFCCDVLEHIPIEYTSLALTRIVENCRTSWLQICFDMDFLGKLVGQPLHLTVKPFSWWLSRISTIGYVIEARDCCGTGVFVVGRQRHV